MAGQRQQKTFIYLLIATASAWISIYYSEYIPLPPLFHPVLFGIALSLSNKEYWKYRSSPVAIPVLFELIFWWGTLPFYAFGEAIGGNWYIMTLSGCFGALVLVLFTAVSFLKEMELTIKHVFILVLSALSGVATEAVLTGRSSCTSDRDLFNSDQAFAFTVLVYQLLMSLMIVSAMRKNNTRKVLVNKNYLF